MKKFLSLILALILLAGIITGCAGGKSQTAAPSGDGSQSEAAGGTEQESPEGNKGKTFSTLKDYVDAVTAIEGQHEAIINQYEGMPVLELPAAMLPIASVPIYEMHNLNNKDGRFEGVGFGSKIPEYIEKRGAQITFGKDGVRENDGFSPDDKKGDRVVENGSLDGERGSLRTEYFAERDGAKVYRCVTQSILVDGESVAILFQYGKSGDKSKTTGVFISAGKENYDFVTATSGAGTDFDEILLDFASTEKAVEAFEANGLTIEMTGGITNGKFEVF